MDQNWQNIAPGAWRKNIGENIKTLTGFAGVEPSPNFKNGPDCDFPVTVECASFGGKTVFRFPIRDHERFFGCGLRFQTILLGNEVIHLRTDHSRGVDNGRTHAAVPFIVSTEGFGFFLDTPSDVSFYIGNSQRKEDKPLIRERDRGTDTGWECYAKPQFLEICVDSSSVSAVLFAGSVKDCTAKFNLYCGGGCLPPKWGFGIWHRGRMDLSEEQILGVVEDYKKHQYPLSVMGLEPGWQSNSYPCTYEWSPRYPEPEKFIAELRSRGIRINLWENPYISQKSALYEKMLPYSASHLVWGGIIPDYTIPEARALTSAQHREQHVNIGISGYKLDESDGYDCYLWPDHTQFPSGTTATEYRNLCGLFFQRITNEIFYDKGERTYGLTRSSNAGCNSFPYVIYNDRYDFKEFLTALVSCGFAGTLWTPELRSADNSDDFLRRIQMAAVSPMLLLNAWAADMYFWQYPEIEPAVRQAMDLREELLPYLYSAFARYHFEGIPPYRSLFMDYGYFLENKEQAKLDGTANPYCTVTQKDITDQFILGDTLMAAPIFPGATERTVIFPAGKWYDFYTGKLVSEGGVATFPVLPDSPIPLFAPDGAVIPLQKNEKIEVRRFGTKPGSFLLYEDDGVSFAYEQGKYTITEIK